MKKSGNTGLIGAALIGLGCGLAAVGIALVIPSAAEWSLGFAEQALKKGKEGMTSAAGTIGELAGKAQQHFGEAAKAHTAKAAGIVETAARSVREYAS